MDKYVWTNNLYIQPNCMDKFVYTIVWTNNVWTIRKENVMTKDKKFSMRVDQIFMDNLNWLSDEMGLSKAATIELVVNLYPELVKMYAKHQELLEELKSKL